jgi:hypothetical protein
MQLEVSHFGSQMTCLRAILLNDTITKMRSDDLQSNAARSNVTAPKILLLCHFV